MCLWSGRSGSEMCVCGAAGLSNALQGLQVVFYVTQQSSGDPISPLFFLSQLSNAAARAYFARAVHNVTSFAAGAPTCYFPATTTAPSTSLTNTTKCSDRHSLLVHSRMQGAAGHHHWRRRADRRCSLRAVPGGHARPSAPPDDRQVYRRHLVTQHARLKAARAKLLAAQRNQSTDHVCAAVARSAPHTGKVVMEFSAASVLWRPETTDMEAKVLLKKARPADDADAVEETSPVEAQDTRNDAVPPVENGKALLGADVQLHAPDNDDGSPGDIPLADLSQAPEPVQMETATVDAPDPAVLAAPAKPPRTKRAAQAKAAVAEKAAKQAAAAAVKAEQKARELAEKEQRKLLKSSSKKGKAPKTNWMDEPVPSAVSYPTFGDEQAPPIAYPVFDA